ncbi:MAG: hypothetical protein QOH90_1267 [Actinomycetota bacterium]|nr:hypothetical protein [Actinomycetota bacterium]
MEELKGWFAGALTEKWFTGPPEVTADREEILVVGTLEDVERGDLSDEALKAAREARIERFREDTRAQRIRIARDAERRFERKVAWGAKCGDVRQVFTTLAMPVMTRLRMDQRRVLDTLVEAGVARSRSHALAWCVHLVGKNEEEWIGGLRDALKHVEKVRAEGPGSSKD